MSWDVQGDLLALLQTNMNPANIPVAFSPAVDVDYVDYEEARRYPRVVLSTEFTTMPGGGSTGIAGIAGDGSGPVYRPRTTVLVDCWGGTEATEANVTAGVHPAEVARALAEEVWRVVHSNTDLAGYHSVSVSGGPYQAHDREASPTVYRYTVPVVMMYDRRPPA